jgi:hypothetical protein
VLINEETVELPTKEELEREIKVLKYNKAPGLYEIPPELWRSIPHRGNIFL